MALLGREEPRALTAGPVVLARRGLAGAELEEPLALTVPMERQEVKDHRDRAAREGPKDGPDVTGGADQQDHREFLGLPVPLGRQSRPS